MTSLEPTFCSKTSWIQIGYGIWVNQILICVGLIFGFSAVALPQLIEEFGATLSEQALIVSVVALSPPIGSIICGLSVDRLGRRFTLMVCVIPIAIGWGLIGFAKKPLDVIVGRCITGVGIGMSLPTVYTYTAEISLPNMRGLIMVLPNLCVGIGLTVQAIFGAIFKWKILCYIGTVYSILLIFMNCCLPESPYYVLLTGDLNDTRYALLSFRARDYDIEEEMKSLKQYKEKHHVRKTSIKEYVSHFLAPGAYIPFTIITFYYIFGQFSGVTIQSFYAVQFLEDANYSLNPFIGNVALGITRIIAGVILSAVIVKLKRRPLAIVSAVILSVICFLLGAYLLLYKEPSVVPIIAFCSYTVTAVFGYISLPAMMAFELFPLEIRGLLGGISLSVLNLLVFTSNYTYPYLRVHLGFPQTIIGFGIVALIGAVYIYFFLPETKGVSLQDIDQRYRKPSRSSSPLSLQAAAAAAVHSASERRHSKILHKNNLERK